MRFRGAEDHHAVDLGGRFLDLQPAAQRIDIAYAERGEFSEAQAAVREHEDDEAIWSCGVGQRRYLFVAQEPLLASPITRQFDSGCRVPDQLAVIHCRVQHHVQYPVCVPDCGTGQTLVQQFDDPGRNR